MRKSKRPGSTSGKTNSPLGEVTVEYFCPVRASMSVTAAAGTELAPGSRIVPETCPVKPCPKDITADASNKVGKEIELGMATLPINKIDRSIPRPFLLRQRKS